jgi:hypothetical protein
MVDNRKSEGPSNIIAPRPVSTTHARAGLAGSRSCRKHSTIVGPLTKQLKAKA